MLGGGLHILWNLFLAASAVGLAQLVAHAIRGRHRVGLALLFAAWLLMLPNTCYLFTEVRHLFDAIDERDLWARTAVSTSARISLAVRGAVLVFYGGAGALTFGLAIRPVRSALEAMRVPVRPLFPFFFVVVSLGVWLGLMLRLNSWDALVRPEHVAALTMQVLRAPRRLIAIGLGAGVLWVVYEIVDVWIDGFALRINRVRQRAPSDAPVRA